MEIEKRNIKKHLFICCNTKEQGNFCSSKNAIELLNIIKTRLRENELWDDYKVTSSGCLGPCARGISATLYPDNFLFTELAITDADRLYEILIS